MSEKSQVSDLIVAASLAAETSDADNLARATALVDKFIADEKNDARRRQMEQCRFALILHLCRMFRTLPEHIGQQLDALSK